jgi:tRNA A37 methylthiotransferase MiaB
VFEYSDEDGTEAAGLPGKVTAATIRRRYAKLLDLAEELSAQRAAERVGTTVEVLVESVGDGVVEGRAAHQAPEVDGSTTLTLPGGGAPAVTVGELVPARVTAADGVDLVAVPLSADATAPLVGAAPGAGQDRPAGAAAGP